ncbi:MAG TPA: hypothetical protein DCY49_00960 [Candidatus Jacksonbacteria bacterium]|nr:hypothetical protein [Candidatus Jacksonbacteria bacterium]
MDTTFADFCELVFSGCDFVMEGHSFKIRNSKLSKNNTKQLRYFHHTKMGKKINKKRNGYRGCVAVAM